MIKTIIFDVGGVLLRIEWDALYTAFAERAGVKPRRVFNFHNRNYGQLLLGKLTFDDFLKAVKVKITPLEAKQIWTEEGVKLAHPNPELMALIDSLRPIYHLQILSNASHGRRLIDEALGLPKHFDEVHYSSVEERMKPDPVFFERALHGTKPEEAVYVDDQDCQVEAAEHLGIRGIKFQNTEALRKELERALAVPSK